MSRLVRTSPMTNERDTEDRRRRKIEKVDSFEMKFEGEISHSLEIPIDKCARCAKIDVSRVIIVRKEKRTEIGRSGLWDGRCLQRAVDKNSYE